MGVTNSLLRESPRVLRSGLVPLAPRPWGICTAQGPHTGCVPGRARVDCLADVIPSLDPQTHSPQIRQVTMPAPCSAQATTRTDGNSRLICADVDMRPQSQCVGLGKRDMRFRSRSSSGVHSLPNLYSVASGVLLGGQRCPCLYKGPHLAWLSPPSDSILATKRDHSPVASL